MLPQRYKLPAHSHSQDESLTVLSGRLYLGHGDTLDPKRARALHTGGYHYLPAKSRHYAFTKVVTVVQVEGEGPFDIVYVDEASDPQNGAPRR